jgi:hypothetical protein
VNKKWCPLCKKNKSVRDFGVCKNRYDGLQSFCKPCKRDYDRRWWVTRSETQRDKKNELKRKRAKTNLQFVINYLKSHSCVDCGQSNPLVLEFDHCSGNKEFSISESYTYSLDRIKKEISKCEVRCANCHRLRTVKQLGWYKGIDF